LVVVHVSLSRHLGGWEFICAIMVVEDRVFWQFGKLW
jgi:hypothetical protein